jgi:hypothetical protein
MLDGCLLLLVHLPFRPQESVDRAVDKLSLRSYSPRSKGTLMREAKLFEQPTGAVIACIGVGCDLCELLMDGECLGEDRPYCFSSETQAPMFPVDPVTEKDDSMFRAEDETYEAKNIT